MTSPYMGGPADTAVGPRGEIASASLIAHSRTFDTRTEAVTDGVFTSIGHSLANATAVEGDSGLIVVDTGDCVQQAARQHADFRRVTDRPVHALVYSHNHYALGARHYVPAGRDGELPVYAHERVHPNLAAQLSDIGPFLVRRACIQFGLFLPSEGPDAMPNHGIGPFLYDLDSYTPVTGYVRPTHTVADGEETVIDGVRFTFFDAPSDTDDTLLMWLPDKDLVVNNVAWPSFFNLYTLRGSEFRNPQDVLRGLDLIRELRPEHLVGVHGAPLHGAAEIRRLVTGYRDAIQFLYDQTVRGINRGLDPDQLVQAVRLPDELAANPLAQEFYGEIPFYVRQIYNGLVGWFGTDTAELHPVPGPEQGRRLVALMGGERAVEKETRAALADHELSWAAQLATYLLHVAPDNVSYRQLKADALRALGQVSTASNTRAWLLTQARELEGHVDTSRPPVRLVNVNQVLQAPPQTYVNALRYRLDPARAAGVDEVLAVRFTDLGQGFGLHIRHGIAEFLDHEPADRTCGVALTFDTWARCIAGETDLDAALRAGSALPLGSPTRLRHALALFEGGSGS